jgi:hypothetical protein
MGGVMQTWAKPARSIIVTSSVYPLIPVSTTPWMK